MHSFSFLTFYLWRNFNESINTFAVGTFGFELRPVCGEGLSLVWFYLSQYFCTNFLFFLKTPAAMIYTPIYQVATLYARISETSSRGQFYRKETIFVTRDFATFPSLYLFIATVSYLATETRPFCANFKSVKRFLSRTPRIYISAPHLKIIGGLTPDY